MQGAHDATAIIYSLIVSSLDDDKNLQIVTNFASIIFNTQVKSLRHDYHIYSFRNVIIASLL